MEKEEENSLYQDHHHAEDLSAKMARKSKPIPPPLNLTAMGESETSPCPLRDFVTVATSPKSPLVQKNLPFRKRAHSYSSTQTSSECDSPESPRVPASPIAKEPTAPSPSLCPQMKSPLSSPTSHFFNKRFLQEPIKSLLPSPNTSASFFNNECDPIKSPMACHSFFRPSSDLLSLPAMEKNSMKSPLQTPTRSVFLQNHVDSSLFDAEKFPMKSPLNTPTRPGFLPPQDFFIMPEPISVKSEPVDPHESEKTKLEDTKPDLLKMQKDLSLKFRNEKENIADVQFSTDAIKQEPMELDFSVDKKSEMFDVRSPVRQDDLSHAIKTEKEDMPVHGDAAIPPPPPLLPLDCHKGNYKVDGSSGDYGVKKEPMSPLRSDTRSQSSCPNELLMSFSYNHFIDNKFIENYKLNNKNFLISQNVSYFCSDLGDPYLGNSGSDNPYSTGAQLGHGDISGRLPSHDFNENNSVTEKLQLMKNSGTYNRTHTYNKSKNNSNVLKRTMSEKNEEDGGKKSKKELDDERPRRPMNAFMLFAKHQRPLLIQQHPGKDNRAISVVLGTAWRELDASERADYVRRAAAMATEHKRRHPDCWKRRRLRVNNGNQTAKGQVSSNSMADVATTS
ncbi:hypothetical protein RUM44_011984 [Polyplax serrata]|uniref:HMG box domain-containing protein n=1 Tax=Polyplax serrata TaxID=468196 RepID=A0ABR1BEY5_POLSC